MKKRITLLTLLSVLILSMLFLSNKPNSIIVNAIDRDHLIEHDFQDINWNNIEGKTISYSDYKNNNYNLGNKEVISFNTAKELYDFSVDVSYKSSLSKSIKDRLMKNNYTLGQDIDYSVMKGSRFIPIGYHFKKISDQKEEKLVFQGSFNGRGFEISNLYLAGYNDLVYVDSIDGLTEDIAISKYHSMFNYNEGIISNLGLINPTIDLDVDHLDIKQFANLVGENRGDVKNVYVIDNRSIHDGGMRISASSTSAQNLKTAAGIIHTNKKEFSDSYYVGKAIINSSYIHTVKAEALIYDNQAVIKNLSYDKDEYLLKVVLNSGVTVSIDEPIFGIGETTSTLKQKSNVLTDKWFYYKEDRYPALWGLEENNNKFVISSALDFVTLNKLFILKNNRKYIEGSYILENDIDFSDLAPNSFKGINIPFEGKLDGNNKTIHNVSIQEGVLRGENYYIGLFSVLNGEVKNLKINNVNIDLKNYNKYSMQNFYIGTIAGKMDNGKIENVFVNGSIKTSSNEKLGKFTIGGLVGEASGFINKSSYEGNIKINNYNDSRLANAKLKIGGLVGSTNNNKLIIYNAINKAMISSEELDYSNSNSVIYVGGIIGYLENKTNANHNIGLVTNLGNIEVEEFEFSELYLAGIIGYSTGSNYDYNEFQGNWENKGSFIYEESYSDILYVSGITNSNHKNDITYIQIYNSNNLTNNKNNLNVAALIYNLGSNLNVNQAKSKGKYQTNRTDKDISVGIYNKNNVETNLKYVEVSNDINIDIGYLEQERSFSGIVNTGKTNFLNVIYSGKIEINIDDSRRPVWVSGFSKELTSGYKIENSINKGFININIDGSNNLYVAGLVNRNLSGDLHNQDNSSRPKAKIGIMNSLNQADFYITQNGMGNVFAGGIATLNGSKYGGSIQDTVNMGNINVLNKNTRGTKIDSRGEGGLMRAYNSSIVIGGISAGITNGQSRIYDISNSGDIVGISKTVVRTGGIVGLALADEYLNEVGNLNSSHYSNNNSANHKENIKNSIISNGINYGKIESVTETYAIYSTDESTEGPADQLFTSINPYNKDAGKYLDMQSEKSSGERIGVNSSSGGIIGYGLVTISRMINHGLISSTDVAGGIVGATRFYVTKEFRHENYPRKDVGINVVDINTAINYGEIRSIDTEHFGKIIEEREVVKNYYRDYNDDFILKNNSEYIPRGEDKRDYLRRHPESKRGIGGIFGRIQRAGDQFIVLDHGGRKGSFDFVVNMNPNVDLIGRLDQNRNFSFSVETYDFYGAKYYSAKEDDNTQTVFTGFTVNYSGNNVYMAQNGKVEITTKNIGGWWGNNIEVEYKTSGSWKVGTFSQDFSQIGTNFIPQEMEFQENSTSPVNIIKQEYTRSEYQKFETEIKFFAERGIVYKGLNFNYKETIDIPYISEKPNDLNAQYIYDENFEMRKDDTILTTGESITSYIYYAENDLLSDRFKDERPNGMYVLSTSSGSTFGSVLPRNFKINNLRTLNKKVPSNIDYSNITDDSYYDNLPDNLIEKYEGLYQTKLNDRSELLKEDQIFEMKDTNDSQLHLKKPNIDYDNKEITFTIYKEMVGNSFELDFDILKATLPSNALIAGIKPNDMSKEDFQKMLYEQRYNSIAKNRLRSNLKIDISNKTGKIYLGTFISYSEAAVNDVVFLDKYITEYEVYLDIKENYVTPMLSEVEIDNLNSENFDANKEYELTNNIKAIFRNTQSLGSEYKLNEFVRLIYIDSNNQEIEVDRKYYSITNEINTNNRMEWTLNFDSKLRAGQYKIGYRYFNLDVEKYINLEFRNISPREIEDAIVTTGSTYDKQSQTADISFGVKLPHNVASFKEIIDETKEPYLDNKTYEFEYFDYIETSDYYDVDRLQIDQIGSLESDGYLSYRYWIYLKENPARPGEIYQHITIKEQKLVANYYQDGIKVDNLNIKVPREMTQSTIEVDYLFHPSIIDTITIDNFVIEGLEEYMVPVFEDGKLKIIIQDKLSPQIYNLKISYKDEDRTIDNIGELKIEKQAGRDAYLKDIKFSNIAQETTYADIYLSDEFGNIKPTNKRPSIYYAGIDYDGLDEAKERHFRIDGKVSNIPLESFEPIMKDYLPLGAKLERKEYIDGVENWTDILAADFTVDPKTNMPPINEEDPIIITYRVTSEDNENEVFYHVTITDAEYNVSLIFDFLYKDKNGEITKISNTHLKDMLLIMNVSNIDVSKDGNQLEVGQNAISNPNNYPVFDKIEKRNNSVNMFYIANSDVSYRFGRNLSGFYKFTLELPNGYGYEINTGSDNQPLSLIEGTNSYYYYINSSVRLRTRFFQIVIYDEELQDNWGLTDNKATYKDKTN